MGNDPILPVSQTRVLNLYTTVTPKLSISSLNKIFMSNIGFCSITKTIHYITNTIKLGLPIQIRTVTPRPQTANATR